MNHECVIPVWSGSEFLVFCCDVSLDVVVAFDLTERSFSEIPLPVDFSEEDDDFDSCELGLWWS